MSRRDQIAEALRAVGMVATDDGGGNIWFTPPPAEVVADILLPLVDCLCAEAFIEGASGALEAALHEVDDDEDAQLLARRADQWRATSVAEITERMTRAAAVNPSKEQKP